MAATSVQSPRTKVLRKRNSKHKIKALATTDPAERSDQSPRKLRTRRSNSPSGDTQRTRRSWLEQSILGFVPGLRRRLVLHAIGLSPCLVMVLHCILSKQAIRAVFTFHTLIIFMPFVFLTVTQCITHSRKSRRQRTVRDMMQHRPYFKMAPANEESMPTSIRYGLMGFYGLSGFGISLYAALRFCSRPGYYMGVNVPELRLLLNEFGISDDKTSMILFALYFTFVNPVLEEYFWRGFMKSEMLAHGASQWWSSLVVSVEYAIYHLLITGSLMPLWFSAFLAFPFLTCFGLALEWICNNEYLGMPTAIGIHSGLDLAAAIWILDLRYGWLDGIASGAGAALGL